MTTIKKNIQIIAPDELDVIVKTIYYFKKSGFSLKEQQENKLIFRRGSIFSNEFALRALEKLVRD